MKCKDCNQDIPDSSKFCRHCGANQDEKTKGKIGVLILDCQHCGGTGECNRGKTLNKIHSDEYCVAKAGIKPGSLFPHVPCAYCTGGKITIDLKIEKPQNTQKQQQKKGK